MSLDLQQEGWKNKPIFLDEMGTRRGLGFGWWTGHSGAQWWWQRGQGHTDALAGVTPQPWHTILQVSEGRNPTATNHLSIVIFLKIRQEQSI